MEAWMTQQPAMDFRGFVRGVVVNDKMKLALAVIGELGIDTLQKGQEFLVAVAPVAMAQDSSGGRIVSGKQRKSPVAHVIMGLTIGQTRTQGQNGLAALQGLGLALLIDTKHDRLIRWIVFGDALVRYPLPSRVDLTCGPFGGRGSWSRTADQKANKSPTAAFNRC